jgi:hypothetical protein
MPLIEDNQLKRSLYYATPGTAPGVLILRRAIALTIANPASIMA